MKPTPTFTPSTIENIDQCIYDWLDHDLNIFCNTHEGYKKVNVVFSTPELASLVYNRDSVDVKNTLKYPIISIMRKNFEKPLNKDLSIQGSRFGNKYDTYIVPVVTSLNQDKTSERANADNKRYAGTLNVKNKKTNRPIYYIYNIPVPTAIHVNYEISIISNFQSQMNDIISRFLKFTNNVNGFKLEKNGHTYECFLDQSISLNSSDDISETERKIEYSFPLKIKGYINEGEMNDAFPSVVRQENISEVIFKSEMVYTGSLN
jgi:hypothetical protein